ncbi:hypothetical protein CJ179_35035 [Rhodococcus sp. ACS1]|uniref:hypothetical protein n=1 Tax=Rhodococcus sp. ACS1 TaxID=2028570 RepID=UPI000BB0EF72|nr:hypothetical protein [Rhodococcus sp. ACS1]PBC39272.1 hypothetical protein CJ179_35035 [Rhodococcus sp. ACS1]
MSTFLPRIFIIGWPLLDPPEPPVEHDCAAELFGTVLQYVPARSRIFTEHHSPPQITAGFEMLVDTRLAIRRSF